MRFKWVKWNIEHIAKNKVTQEEAESVFYNPFPGYPRKHKKSYVIWGKSYSDRYIQIAYSIEPDGRVFIFHARDLKKSEKRRIKK